MLRSIKDPNVLRVDVSSRAKSDNIGGSLRSSKEISRRVHGASCRHHFCVLFVKFGRESGSGEQVFIVFTPNPLILYAIFGAILSSRKAVQRRAIA